MPAIEPPRVHGVVIRGISVEGFAVEDDPRDLLRVLNVL
jgi:hypothetical protein